MKTAIYLRVSTVDQLLDSQRDAVARHLQANPPDGPVEEYVDAGISGASNHRGGFNEMMADIRRRRIDTVIVYKLDRLSRNAATAIQTVLEFDRLGVKFVSTSQPMFSHGTPFRHAIIAIFAELAQMERDLTIERVKAGMAAAKARGARFGAMVRVTPESIGMILRLRAQTPPVSYKDIANQVNLSTSTVHRVVYGWRGPPHLLTNHNPTNHNPRAASCSSLN